MQTDDHAIATAADYADALLTARRAKNWVFALLLGVLLFQLAVFAATYGGWARIDADVAAAVDAAAPAATATATAPADLNAARRAAARTSALHYVTGLSVFLGLILSLLLIMVLLLIVGIMLVGRLIGISHVTAALIGSLLLALLLFPWQAFLSNADIPRPQFAIPGVLYCWDELVSVPHRFAAAGWEHFVLNWARFVVFPLAAVTLLVVVQRRSRRGLRLALGEEQPPSVADAGDHGRTA
jgi:hypothetical protein